MPDAFSRTRIIEMQAAVRSIFKKYLTTIPAPNLRASDIYELVTHEEERERLQYLESEMRYFGLSPANMRTSYNIRWVEESRRLPYIGCLFNPPMEGMLPYKQNYYGEILSSRNPEKFAEIEAWLSRRRELGIQFGAMHDFVGALNEKLNNPTQYVHFFNGALTLMAESDKGCPPKLLSLRRPTSAPGLSLEMREAGVQFSALLAKSKLISTENLPIIPVSLNIEEFSLGLYAVPWQDTHVKIL